jgi:hypothetical protein
MLLASAAVPRVEARPGEPSEHELKAGYVYNFAKLVEWPASLAERWEPIVIGVLGNDEFARVLGRAVAGKTIDDRPLVVRRLTGPDVTRCACRILFVAGRSTGVTPELVRLQNAESVLTIAEYPEFARRGGIVALTLRNNKVRLFVNVDAAERASLNISSRLLTLATIVHTPR